MRVLVTGGFGYIGGRVVSALASQPGTEVSVFAHGGRAVPPGVPEGVRIHRGDIVDATGLREACRGVSHVVHLAGLDQSACLASPAAGLTVSGIGTWRVAEEAAAAGARRLLCMSTFHVYGDVASPRLTEALALRPLNPYGVSRMTAEAVARMVGWQRGLEVVVLRLSNGFGPPAFPVVPAWRLAVNDFCLQAVRKRQIVLKRSGIQQRDFVALSDIVSAVDRFLALPDDRLGDGVFNIGGDRIWTLLEMADRVRREYKAIGGPDVEIRTGSDDGPERPMAHFDVARAMTAGFSPRDPGDEIRQTLAAAAGPLAADVV